MAQSKTFSDEERLQIIQEEMIRVRKLIKGHEQVLDAIGKL